MIVRVEDSALFSNFLCQMSCRIILPQTDGYFSNIIVFFCYNFWKCIKNIIYFFFFLIKTYLFVSDKFLSLCSTHFRKIFSLGLRSQAFKHLFAFSINPIKKNLKNRKFYRVWRKRTGNLKSHVCDKLHWAAYTQTDVQGEWFLIAFH